LPPREADRNDRLERLFLLGPAALAAEIVWLATGGFGCGLTPDSVQFLACAKSLASGGGWVRVEGAPFVEWAPLLPGWLALGTKLGDAPLALARITEALAAAGITWAIGLWTSRAARSRLAGLVAALAVALSLPLLHASAHLWSDAPFLCFALLGVLGLGDARARPAWRTVGIAALWAALAALTRYLGVTLIAAGALALATQRRWKHALGYTFLSLLPLALWLARNAALTGTATGVREPPGATWPMNLSGFLHGAIDPLVPWPWPGAIKLALLGVLAALAWIVLRRESRDEGAGPLALFVFLYGSAVVIVSSIWGSDAVDVRLALPLSMALCAGALLATAKARGRWLRLALLSLVVLWLGRELVHAREVVTLYRQEGVPGFSDRQWTASPTLARLRSHPPRPPFYSNAPEIAWLALERPVRLSPRAHLFYDERSRVDDLDRFVADLGRDSSATLIWFREVDRRSLVPRDSLARRVTLKPIADLPDGTLDEASR